MAELVQLKQRIVKRAFKVKMSCISTLFLIVRGILNRCEILNRILRGNNDHTAGVLSRCTLYSRTADSKSVKLCFRGYV